MLIAVDGYRWTYIRDASAGAIPTNDGAACVFVTVPAAAFAATFGGGIQHFLDRRIALDAGLLFSHGTFTDATVNGAFVPDYRGDAVWSSRFNLGGRMYFR